MALNIKNPPHVEQLATEAAALAGETKTYDPIYFLYDVVMDNVKQIAFQIDVKSLAEIDALTPVAYSSRAEVLRVAVHDWLSRRREEATDAALAKGYGIVPQSTEEDAWAEQSLEGLKASNLDW